MILPEYRSKILFTLRLMTSSDIKLLVWLTLSAQYKNGLIIITKEKIEQDTDVSKRQLARSFPKLIALGLIKKEKRRHYRVNLTFPTGRNGVKIPVLPMLPKE